eukprot:TRINITY_DN1230_c0_g1_i6.p1 TRINITY_DN1230_c0_g1~~TRINITY_DN1230_c0_g1_i6.p1  ORF type:complete len:236 (+),score=13.79 TRINITY_DN1230_c0_g1_i6:92-799(+)
MIRRPPRSTLSSSSAASDVYKRQVSTQSTGSGPSIMVDKHNPSRRRQRRPSWQWDSLDDVQAMMDEKDRLCTPRLHVSAPGVLPGGQQDEIWQKRASSVLRPALEQPPRPVPPPPRADWTRSGGWPPIRQGSRRYGRSPRLKDALDYQLTARMVRGSLASDVVHCRSVGTPSLPEGGRPLTGDRAPSKLRSVCSSVCSRPEVCAARCVLRSCSLRARWRTNARWAGTTWTPWPDT